MVSKSFEISYSLKDNSVIVLSLQNNIYDENLPQLKELFSEFLIKNINNIILDLSKCMFIEKEIWEYIIQLKKDLSQNKGNIVLSNMFGVVKSDYNLMELSNFIDSFQDINDALYNFGILTDIKSA
ncbi:STAS domain-containing protein [uncultured Brachyspira sp.]|uniref:STAS domain-containing protein n=1 Tax=uncultured Brachyspira sp. TaxID=221953 RepID=UPI0026108DB5|nr:STAS domain-containing protein [uncultured Brachyspira sp.]